MSKRKDKVSSTLSKIITYILVVLLLLGFAGVIVYFVAKNGGVSFYVEYNGDTYYSNSENQSIYLDTGTHDFTVKSLSDEQADYTVKVVAVADSNFVFTIDELIYQFYGTDEANNDYSEVFGLQLIENGFTLSVPENFSVKQAVEEKYDGAVELEQPLQNDLCYFAISVVSGDNIVYLPFTFGLIITVDPPSIIF